MMRRDQTGGVLTGWLTQLLVILAVIGMVAYEVVVVGVAAVALEDDAREVAKMAADAYGSLQRIDDAVDAAERGATTLGVDLLDVTLDGEHVRVTVRGQADTWMLHRLGALEDLTRPTATGRSNWRL